MNSSETFSTSSHGTVGGGERQGECQRPAAVDEDLEL